ASASAPSGSAPAQSVGSSSDRSQATSAACPRSSSSSPNVPSSTRWESFTSPFTSPSSVMGSSRTADGGGRTSPVTASGGSSASQRRIDASPVSTTSDSQGKSDRR